MSTFANFTFSKFDCTAAAYFQILNFIGFIVISFDWKQFSVQFNRHLILKINLQKRYTCDEKRPFVRLSVASPKEQTL